MFVHPHLVPRIVLIDPELLLGLPSSVTASGGFDAIGHAVESLLSTFRTPVTTAPRARRSRCCPESLAGGVRARATSSARYGTALGAYQAGLALNASVVLGHSLAYAIASRTGLPHGVTVAMALPYCLAHARHGVRGPDRGHGPDRLRRARPRALRPVDRRAQPPDARSRPRSRSSAYRARRCPPMAADCVEQLPASESSGPHRPAGRPGAARTSARRRAVSKPGTTPSVSIDSEVHA